MKQYYRDAAQRRGYDGHIDLLWRVGADGLQAPGKNGRESPSVPASVPSNR